MGIIVRAVEIPRIVNKDDMTADGVTENGIEFYRDWRFHVAFRSPACRIMRVKPKKARLRNACKERWKNCRAVSQKTFNMGKRSKAPERRRVEGGAQLDGNDARKQPF